MAQWIDAFDRGGNICSQRRNTVMNRLRVPLVAATIAISVAAVVGQTRGPAPAALPDWSGAWTMQGPTIFDRGTAQPPNVRVTDPRLREFPPYNAEWEAKYVANLARVAAGTF